MDTTDIINIFHDITSFVIYLSLLLLTVLYIIFYQRKNEIYSIKEKINFNLIVAYFIFSFLKIVMSINNLFIKEGLSLDIISAINVIFSSLLIVCYCFYIYLFSLSIKIHKESNFLFSSIMFWLIGTFVFIVSFIIIKMKINKFTFLSILMLTIKIGLQLVISVVLIIKIISLIREYNKLWKEYDKNAVDDEKEKFNNKKRVIFVSIMIILNIALNLGYFIYKMIAIICSILEVKYNDNIDLIGKIVLLFTNSINHILVLLIFIYDEDIYDKILCKKSSTEKNDNSNEMNVEFFPR